MRHLTQWIGATLFAMTALGCTTTTPFPGQPTARDLANDMMIFDPPATTRAQRGDEPIVVAQAPKPSDLPPPLPQGLTSNVIAPPPPLTVSGRAEIAPPPNVGSGPTQQVSMSSASRGARVLVRAWVNGRPIFDDEIMLQMEMSGAARGATGDKLAEAYNQTLTNIIELEIAYQDAVKKLEKAAPRMLDQLKEAVDAEYQKQARHIRKQVPEDKFLEIAAPLRRLQERQFIGMEYIRSRIIPVLKINYVDIEDYYKTHLNEFQTLPSVKWQHVFIATNSQRRTAEDAAAFGATLIDQVSHDGKPGERFVQLGKQFDDGDSKTRDGLGFGVRKGEIQPPELEAELFKMAAGQIGILKVTTGAHVYRLESRVEGGQTPLNDTVQNQIRNKIRNQVFEREFKRLVRELKTRAVVEIERGV